MHRIEFKKAKAIISKKDSVALVVIKKYNSDEWNVIPVQWFTQTSMNPPMFAVSIGHTRFSYKCLQEADEFNICIPSKNFKGKLLACAKSSGSDINKFEEFGIDYFYGRYRRVPILKNSIAAFECKYISQIKTGDHTLFIGECKYSWLDEVSDNQSYLTMQDL